MYGFTAIETPFTLFSVVLTIVFVNISRKLQLEEEAAFSTRNRKPVFLRKFLKRFKWLGIQAALLAFNFAQNEWVSCMQYLSME